MSLIGRSFFVASFREKRLLRKAQLENGDGPPIAQMMILIQRQAAVLEELLFQQQQQQQLDVPTRSAVALDWDDSMTDEEWNERLTFLLGQILQRRAGRTSAAAAVTTHAAVASSLSVTQTKQRTAFDLRQTVLRDCLGPERYQRANTILQTIHQLGTDLTGKCFFDPHEIRLLRNGGAMPDPVRRLFCATSLRHVMQRTPVAELPTQSWDTLLQQAEQHVAEYRSWVDEQRRMCE
jgi:hypothetical protein